MKGTTSRLTALLAALTALSGCIPAWNAGCITDPATGKVTCQGDWTPPPPAEPAAGERG